MAIIEHRPRSTRIVVTMVLDVDADAWGELYGDGPGMKRRALFDDVKQYARSQVALSAAAEEEAIVGVYLR